MSGKTTFTVGEFAVDTADGGSKLGMIAGISQNGAVAMEDAFKERWFTELKFLKSAGDGLADPGKAKRFNTGKLKWSLVDFLSLEDMVQVLEFGAKKYSPDNWKKGLPTAEVFESLMRHLVALQGGQINDPETGLPHTGHILCNAMFLAHMYKFKPEFISK